jgi:predicted CXXCH cytochrome family protein
MTIARTLLALTSAAAAAGAACGQGYSVVETPHNLSASGPGDVRAAREEQVCIFCHTPHNASPIRPLWNRDLPLNAYSVYTSSALDARPGQPTGDSKMCLSCHDGTIALGSVVSQDQLIQMVGGITTLPAGRSNLGTDLSDDHPISFRYDASLAVRDRRLVHPQTLPSTLPLDAQGEMQCTTCHDAHDNVHGDFLRMANLASTMCVSCHRISSTNVQAHQECTTCHQTHTAPSGPFLLRENTVTETCISCHDGSDPRALDIASQLMQRSVHDTKAPVPLGEPTAHDPQHVSCVDCHEPHSMRSGLSRRAPNAPPVFGQVSGVNSSSSPVKSAGLEFEVCYKCHADVNVFDTPWVPRQITQVNTRREFDLSSISFHPVEGPGRNNQVPSLKPGWTTSSVMYCGDCHGSSTSRKAGGSGPNGPHGSNEPPLLVARYSTADFTAESTSAYALCYECHYRDGPTGILSDVSFPHSVHVSDSRTPCSACHDAHGISSLQGRPMNNTHLMNFDTTIVFPNNGRLRFRDLGNFRGSCTVECHGVRHLDTEYSRGRGVGAGFGP